MLLMVLEEYVSKSSIKSLRLYRLYSLYKESIFYENKQNNEQNFIKIMQIPEQRVETH